MIAFPSTFPGQPLFWMLSACHFDAACLNLAAVCSRILLGSAAVLAVLPCLCLVQGGEDQRNYCGSFVRLVMVHSVMDSEKIINKMKASALACMMQAHAYMCMYVRDNVSSFNSVTS